MNNGDIYNRVKISPNRYQCGCEWVRTWDEHGRGDRLVECMIHKQATCARVARFERERQRPIVRVGSNPNH